MSKQYQHKFTGYSLFAACVAAIGGLLFGYNTTVISGVLLFLSEDFHLTTLQQELIVSTLLIGALIGALVGGFIADQFGRKKTLFLTLLLFFIGTLTLTRADAFDTLLIGRFVSGFAIGIASVAVPLYIAEISPSESRGILVSLNQFGITIGILLAYIVSYAYADTGEWRWMFGFGLIPAAIQFVGLLFVSETHAWLKSHSTAKVAPQGAATRQGWRELFNPAIRRALLIGVGINVFQQITGINTVIYYAPRIFQLAGFESANDAIFASILLGVVNVCMTFVALWLVDRIGRRPLLIAGLTGMALALATLGVAFLSAASVGAIASLALMVYVACFAFSLGPCVWLIISEIYPLGIRGRAMGIATFANWIANYFVSLTFLTLIDVLGTGSTFWLYAIICLFALWFVIRLVPETRGKTLEQIQQFWKKS